MDACGALVDGAVTCTSAGNPYSGGVYYEVPGDLSVKINSDVQIQNSTEFDAGISPNSTAKLVVINDGSIAGGITAANEGSGLTFLKSNSLSNGIFLVSYGPALVISNSVTSAANNTTALAIEGHASVKVISDNVVETGQNAFGIGVSSIAASPNSRVEVYSSNVSTVGGVAISANNYYGSVFVVSKNISISPQAGFSLNSVRYAIEANGASGSTYVSNIGNLNINFRDFGGISATNQSGDVTVSNTGAINTLTTAIYANAGDIVTVSSPGSIVDGGGSSLPTSGADQGGIVAIAPNAVSVTAGAITMLQAALSVPGSPAILATSTGGGPVDVTVDGPITTYGTPAPGVQASGQSVAVTIASSGSITTYGGALGETSPGVFVQAGTGLASVTNAGAISTSGEQSDGIFVTGGQSVQVVNSGQISTTTMGAAGIFASGGGGVTIDNSGLIASDGTAVSAQGSPVILNNTGTIQGALQLTSSGSVFNNAGTFVASGSSSFGSSGVVNNTGTVTIAKTGAPIAVGLNDLQAFNNSGLVDLRNGVAGDVLTISGPFNGKAGSSLAIDVQMTPNGVATDKLVVGGLTGSTSLQVNSLGASPGVLTPGVAVVQVGSAATPSALTLANGPIVSGFVQYGLSYDPSARTFDLIGVPDAAAYETEKFVEGAQNVWRESVQAWSDHLGELRHAQSVGDDLALSAGVHSWGQAFGSSLRRDTTQGFAAFGQAQSVDLSYRQDFLGFETGFDFVSPQPVGLLVTGVTGGFTTSNLNFSGTGDGATYQAANIGGYAAYLLGPFFVNGLVKYDDYDVAVLSTQAQYGRDIQGAGYGGSLEVGYRLDLQRVYIEPLASVGYVQTHLGSIAAQGSTLDLHDGDSLSGKVGVQVGAPLRSGGPFAAAPYLGLNAVNEFEGRNSVVFSNGGYNLGFANERPGAYGQAIVGLNFATVAGLVGFIQGEGDFGGFSGGGGRVGFRWKW